MSDENLTFVGGKAIEQHEALDSNVEADVREEAMEAVREAIKGAAEESKSSAGKASKNDGFNAGAKKDTDEAPERGPDGKFLPRKDKAEEDDDEELPDPSKASLKQLLKNRDKITAQKREQHDAFAQQRQQLEAETRKIQETWAQMQHMQQEIARERAKLELFRKNPAAAIRELGYEPEQFILDLAQDGTPEGQAQKQMREFQRQMQEMNAWKEEQARQAQEAQERAMWDQQVQYREHIKSTFLGDALNEETRPHTAAFYKGRENALMAQADFIAAEYRQMSGGREASLQEVADYIEEDLAERASRWYESRNGQQKVSAQSPARPGKGSKGKSLNPDAVSERRSLGRKTLKDVDDEERLAAAKEAVGLALQDSED